MESKVNIIAFLDVACRGKSSYYAGDWDTAPNSDEDWEIQEITWNKKDAKDLFKDNKQLEKEIERSFEDGYFKLRDIEITIEIEVRENGYFYKETLINEFLDEYDIEEIEAQLEKLTINA